MRKRKKVPVELLAPYIVPDCPRDQPPPPLNWQEMFGNMQPVEVEVGFGKGLFLHRSAKDRPGTNFFGIEIVRKYQLWAATNLYRDPVPNLKFACGDAKVAFSAQIEAGSVSAVHIYYPDPWWKKRHSKRRLFTEEFAADCLAVLRIGGHLHLVTDVADYFEMEMEVMAAFPEFQNAEPPPMHEGKEDMDYLTHFERKFRKEGRAVYRASYTKIKDRVRPPALLSVSEPLPASAPAGTSPAQS